MKIEGSLIALIYGSICASGTLSPKIGPAKSHPRIEGGGYNRRLGNNVKRMDPKTQIKGWLEEGGMPIKEGHRRNMSLPDRNPTAPCWVSAAGSAKSRIRDESSPTYARERGAAYD